MKFYSTIKYPIFKILIGKDRSTKA